MSESNPNNILVIRNDKLGDFMLAWPALSLLRKQQPDANISVLVAAYTAPIARLCPSIDQVIIDTEKTGSLLRDSTTLADTLTPYHFDAVIALFTETRTALACWRANIPLRIAPATKLAQLFSNRRLKQKRSQSAKPEHEYNTDLIRYFIALGNSPSDNDQDLLPGPPPYLRFAASDIRQQREETIRKHGITANTIVMLHPGSGGSAVNLSLEQYACLLRSLAEHIDMHVILTCGPSEKDIIEKLGTMLGDVKHSLYHSTQGLEAFALFISIADLFISGSTGPLHIAGALNLYTAAFYPARRSATALRWQTTNAAERRIHFSPEKYRDENDMLGIDPILCAEKITRFMASQPS